MSDKNMEMMKKIIEEKKKKSAEQGFSTRTDVWENKNSGKKKKKK